MEGKMFKILFFIVFILILSTNAALLAALNEVALIRRVKGNVWITKVKDGKKTKADPFCVLKKGDLLKTEDNGEVLVRYFYGKKERYLSSTTVRIGYDNGAIIKGKKDILPVISNIRRPALKARPIQNENNWDIIGFYVRGIPQPLPDQYFSKPDITRYAVIIGISKFKDSNIPELKYAVNDAEAFRNYLLSPFGGSFDNRNIRFLKNENATQKNIKEAITTFLKKTTGDDLVIIFIAGHGVDDLDRPGNFYLLTHDTEIDKLASTAYNMDYMNSDMKRYISAEKLILLADTCHSGAININNLQLRPRGVSNNFNTAISAISHSKNGWAMITASRAGEVALEFETSEKGHGVFTYYLLDGLYGKADITGNYNGIITITEAFDYVEGRVKYATRNLQHPVISGDFDYNLPIGFLPSEESKNNIIAPESSGTQTASQLAGTINIKSSDDNANIFINEDFVGKTSKNEPFSKNVSVGSAKVNITKKGLRDFERIVYVNPNETSSIYAKMRSAEDGKTHVQPVLTTDDSKLKDNIDRLLKELEEMRLKQMEDETDLERTKIKKTPVRKLFKENTIPVSIKRFTANMNTLFSQSDMDILRARVIDELSKNSDISIVERDLEYQEELLREQRIGGSILADEMYRIELGNILAANFICFSSVLTDYDTNNLILRMEIVESTTTLVKPIEHRFGPGGISLNDPKLIASKISKIVSGKVK